VRVHPEATVRPWATCEVIGDALSFASALGYVSVYAQEYSSSIHVLALALAIPLDNDRRYTSGAMRFVEEL
jgi:hypothetical protein